jgi:hypothetical protein
MDYFSSLDQDGGFFYERWGDAPVHSIAAATMLKKEQIHFFNEIAYYHVPFTHCPSDEQTRLDLRCHCKPEENFDWKGYSCKNPCSIPQTRETVVANAFFQAPTGGSRSTTLKSPMAGTRKIDSLRLVAMSLSCV